MTTNTASPGPPPDPMPQAILRLLARQDYAPANVPQLLQRLGCRPDQQQALQKALRALEQNGQIIRNKGNRYIQAREVDLVPGVIRMNRQGKGFLEPDEAGQQEIVVPESATSTALHGDHVLVRRDVARRRGPAEGNEITGSVVRILKRKRAQIVGTLQRSKQFLFVIPDDPRIPHDIYVPPARDTGRPANIGDKVVVELRAWESRHTNPEGEIIEVLGPPDEEGVDMLSILRCYNLPLHFPKKAIQEADRIAKLHTRGEPPAEECRGRVDCRAHCVVTIDPDDAKDFDDAICLQKHGKDQWKLWVHIADVSHYVRPGGVLDEEARKRGNSTYLVDRVIPMLPEALSNETLLAQTRRRSPDQMRRISSFPRRPRAGRQVLSGRHPLAAPFYLQGSPGRPARPALGRSGANRWRNRPMPWPKKFAPPASGPARSTWISRNQKLGLTAHGRVLLVEKIENDVSHQLIEECMLLANEAVAARLMALRRPAVYRVHEPPADLRLQEYRQDVLSHDIPCGNLAHRPEVQKLLQRLNSLPIGPALKIGFLKSLMRARYAVEPLGHYGLSKAKYTHFTSPIRRYADLLVHRALFDDAKTSLPVLKEAAAHISITERNSADAERDSKDIKMFAFLKAQLKSGQAEKYPALVIDVRNFGFFVDVSALGLSGLVHLSSVEDDFYVFEPARNHLIGRRTRRIIKLGDKVMVQVFKVDGFKKQVDFQLVTAPRAPRPHRSGRRF